VLRAMQVVERSGRPAVGIFGEGFAPMARLLSAQMGLPVSRLAVYPGMMATASHDELRRTSVTDLYPQALRGFLEEPEMARPAGGAPASPSQSPSIDIVNRGDLDEVTDFFYEKGWSDGLPFTPPTPERVAAFLRCTGREPGEVLGVLAPEDREATVLSVAVNGVMAGCRPEYMPVLVAVAECLGDPRFRIEDSGSTPGWEPMVVVSGPLARTLDFNTGTGALRVGRRANSTVGRFTRLFMRNIAGLRIPPGVTDQAGMGANFMVALAENVDVAHAIGWPTYGQDRGFGPDDTVVTVQSVLNVSAPIYTHGDDPAGHLEVIAYHLERSWSMVIPAFKRGGGYVLLVLSPAIAQVFAEHGIDKPAIRRYLVENARTRAGYYESGIDFGTPFDIQAMVREGLLPADLAESDDPDRLIRVFLSEEWLGIVIAGNPGRNQSRAYGTNHVQGLPVSRRVFPRP
jgi:hypothetical protein